MRRGTHPLTRGIAPAWAAGLVLAVALGLAPRVDAQVGPGPLNRFHAALEGAQNCTLCHSEGRRIDARKCLDCHAALNDRIVAGHGLHARSDHALCQTCHVEHYGRDYDLIWWGKAGRSAFAHALTGYPLDGRHGGLDCARCHQADRVGDAAGLKAGKADPQRTFLGLSRECRACHQDVHQGRLGAQCESCHSTAGWSAGRAFDHGRTRFPLTGKHADLACDTCHRPGAELPAEGAGRLKVADLRFGSCADCHKDPHRGRLGATCDRCHTTAGWQQVAIGSFDHDGTRYPLRGRHVGLACAKCHQSTRPTRGSVRFARCNDCHADAHRGQFADREDRGDCAQCHTVEGFAPPTFTIERHAQTAFPLLGAHLAVPCSGCHARPGPKAPTSAIPFSFASTRCADCHRDPHRGRVTTWVEKGGCESCHAIESWRALHFDHGGTRFPLSGKHGSAACVDCHEQELGTEPAGALRLRGLSVQCEGCHPDPHRGQFTTPSASGSRAERGGRTHCEHCHDDASAWRADLFDHNRNARFKLDGAHARLACDRCHPREGAAEAAFVRYRPLPQDCVDCHGGGSTRGRIPARESPPHGTRDLVPDARSLDGGGS